MARPQQLADVLEVLADAIPDRPAVITGDTERTYAEFDERATRASSTTVSPSAAVRSPSTRQAV